MPPRGAGEGRGGGRGRGEGRGGGRGGGAPRGRGTMQSLVGNRGGIAINRGAAPSNRGTGFPNTTNPLFGRGVGGVAIGGPGAPVFPVEYGDVPIGGLSHIEPIGVRRPGLMQGGRATMVFTNTFETSIMKNVIYHYDVVIHPAERVLPGRLCMEIITRLMTRVAPDVFVAKAVYDTRKNLYAPIELKFPNGQPICDFLVGLEDNPPPPKLKAGGDPKGPKAYKVTLKLVATINPESLQRFIEGKQSSSNDILTAINALNVVVRMQPWMLWPFNIRSFFTSDEKRHVGKGVEVWRGYFQSVRPVRDKMIINVDISTGHMYKPGPLIPSALEWLSDYYGMPVTERTLVPGPGERQMNERVKAALQKWLTGMRVICTHRPGQGANGRHVPKILRAVLMTTSRTSVFKDKDGGSKSVQQYFESTYNKKLQYPDVICIQIGAGAVVPMEICEVLPGQIIRKQIPPKLISEILKFATQRPQDRLISIRNSRKTLAYGTSEYLKAFNMDVKEDPLLVPARVLTPPRLSYGAGPILEPREGSWNMRGRKFFKCAQINQPWALWNFDVRTPTVDNYVIGFHRAAQETGLVGINNDPQYWFEDPFNYPHENFDALLERLWAKSKARFKLPPLFIVMILPTGSSDLYSSVKYFGDIDHNIVTQCLSASKLQKSNEQYWGNVMLKLNAKLGGVNCIPNANDVPYLMNKADPTLVLGADVVHPSPGSDGRPSFSSLVSNVDSNVSKYTASLAPQTSRQELISDLEKFTDIALKSFNGYRRGVEKMLLADNAGPSRIIFFRDGVSEGQFQHVLEYEVPAIKAACVAHGMTTIPPITCIIVGKRHHIRMFPRVNEGDRSGNCPTGTVIDQVITHPTDFDFFLQSHAGLLGTSKPSHYSVILDENKMKPDDIAKLCYSLCHVYARSTRAVSIPAPVYYAHIVCDRYKNHFKPGKMLELERLKDGESDPEDGIRGTKLELWKHAFRPVKGNAAKGMYFM